ncbi:oligosaccharide flippase family protein [Streptomyces sp. PKU-EA00015]|uniref:lipopolysaccharide biosynthesis protein n=1 Tax=Streptomyces sp. PKU-EA00015 TaxID=2748326 RepID=UPI00159F71A6|nr:oligosaccharide flippase family protein [Streptomyces sp. PKU-EA00015]NWF24845.1 oligosaccharide flippase family protein [Streptomyces sp. PKU-EA00015]
MADGARQALGMLGSQVACLVLSAFTSAVIARSLEPEGRGVYYMAVTVATTATALGHLSVEQAQSTLWTDAERRAGLAGNSVPLALVLGTLGGLVTTACVAAIGPETLHLSGILIVVAACIGVPLGVGVIYANNIVLLLGRPHVANLAALARSVLQCGTLLVLAATSGLSPMSVVLVWVATEGVSLLVFMAVGGAGARRPDVGLLRSTVVTGMRYHLGPASVFLLLHADVFLLGIFTDAREVGIYTLAATLTVYSRLLPDVLSQVVLNRQFQRSAAESADVTVRTTRLSVLLSLISALLLAACAPVMVPTVFGKAYVDAVPLVVLLAPGALALGASRPPSAYLLRLRRARLVVVPAVTALAGSIALSLVLMPVLGAVGCAVASSVSYLMLAVTQMCLFAKVTGTRAMAMLPTYADMTALLAALRRTVPGEQPRSAPSPLALRSGARAALRSITRTMARRGSYRNAKS